MRYWILTLPHPGSIFDTLDFDNHTPAAGITQQTISVERQVLSMVFVAWASSFGLDHRGGPIDLPSLIVASGQGPGVTPRSLLQSRTHMLVNEILGLVDAHGILRNPTWDGARALLLLWPLTQGVQSHLERTVRLLFLNLSRMLMRLFRRLLWRRYSLKSMLSVVSKGNVGSKPGRMLIIKP